MRLTAITVTTLLATAAFGQANRPAFQAADIHTSPSIRNPQMQGGSLLNGHVEIHQATMLDLIKTAYGVDADTVFGGPSWLEWDRYDIVAKAPPGTRPDALKPMLQALLADRFKLVVHRDTKPIQGFVLTSGKGKPKLKEAADSTEPGCFPQPLPPPSPDYIPPQTVSCRDITMQTFAAILHSLGNAYLDGPVLDSTGLKGAWDFDVTWTGRGLLAFAGADGITLFDALDKQLGLKLAPGKVPMPVLVVDSANEKPTANAPNISTLLPPLPSPEFEVASLRRTAPDDTPMPSANLPGGRIERRGYPLLLMIIQAWDVNLPPPNESVPGSPKWLTPLEPRYDLIAKAPVTTLATSTTIYNDDLGLMFRALLLDRFKMKVHYEDRPVDAYAIVADKPKLKPADPSARTGCKTERPIPDPTQGPPPAKVTCLNVTMAQLAEQLPQLAPVYTRYPALDATGIHGSYDVTFTFSPVRPGGGGGGGGRGGVKGGPPQARPAPDGASDPSGGVSLPDAFEKQLGLKLELRKRTLPVFVIDHIEENPTDN